MIILLKFGMILRASEDLKLTRDEWMALYSEDYPKSQSNANLEAEMDKHDHVDGHDRNL